jgi:hypothetical protein
MVIDDEIIVIAFAFFLVTVAWRYLFRWDTRNRLRMRGIDRTAGTEFTPPFPRQSNDIVAVISSASWNLALRCTWLVQGLLAAGFRVLLLPETKSIDDNLQQSGVHDVIIYNSFSSVKTTSIAVDHALAVGINRAILVNYGGTRGLENIRTRVLGTRGQVVKEKHSTWLISETKMVALPEAEQELFKEVLLVQRSRGQLCDAELLAIGTILRWMA